VEVLPLHERARENPRDAVDKGLDQRCVVAALQSPLPEADVVGILQQLGVVGADVQADRKALRRVQAGHRTVERHPPARDADAAGALIACAQHTLVVGDDDQAHLLVGSVPEDLWDAVRVVRGDPDALGAPEDVAVLLAGPTNGRRVDDRHQLGQVVDQHPVEQRSRCGSAAPAAR